MSDLPLFYYMLFGFIIGFVICWILIRSVDR